MKRVVVTGMGIVSSVGNNKKEVWNSLVEGKSGIETSEDYKKMGLHSQIHGSLKGSHVDQIDRKLRRFMGDGAVYSYLAMKEAIEDSKLKEDQIVSERIGLVVGSGGPSTSTQVETADTLREKGIRRVSAYAVPKAMSSTLSANLSTAFQIKGVNYSITSACSTSAHCIGHASELIQLGKQDVVFAGGGEELHWTLSMLFDGMRALSSKYNESPKRASRAFDQDRDGFVISGGGGILVVEELEHALRRGAPIYAELVGYGANSDGADMVAPSGEGAIRCMDMALKQAKNRSETRPVDYINAHGTSTPVGDLSELSAVRHVFHEGQWKQDVPRLSSTKSLTGHSLGAAGVHEAIYSLLMMQNQTLIASANIENLVDEAEGIPVLRENWKGSVKRVMSNSFGFGGTNACLIFDQFEG